MISNLQFFKGAVEKKLRKIKEHKLDIAILGRKIEEFCSQNYIERDDKKYTIEDLTNEIGTLEKELEEDLTASKEIKIDTPVGWVDFKDMPDEWIYDIPKIMAFLKLIPKKIANKFIKITTILQKAELKKTIINDNPTIFEKSKITDFGFLRKKLDTLLNIVYEDRVYSVEGIEIKRQKPKFHYKIKSD